MFTLNNNNKVMCHMVMLLYIKLNKLAQQITYH